MLFLPNIPPFSYPELRLYNNLTFRLSRLRSEKYTQSGYEFTRVSGTVRQDNAYVYDLSGNILTIKDRTPGSGITDGPAPDALDRLFTYDPLYRLLAATGREKEIYPNLPWEDNYPPDDSDAVGYSQSYAYDKLGNMLALAHHGAGTFTRSFSYVDGSNRLDKITVGGLDYVFGHDASGNQIRETEARHFEWDFVNNLRCYFNQTGAVHPGIYTLYLYDSTGNRVKKLVRTSGGGYESTSYINGLYEYKTDGTDEQATLHLMDDRVRIATIRVGDDFDDDTDAIKYNLDDHLGSSICLLDTNGGLISKEEYYPFGETSFGSYASKRYRFCGKEKDAESGLYYYGMRYYAPWMCRFISVDPLAAKYSFYTPYQYAGNKPIIAIDIDGLEDDSGIGQSNNVLPIQTSVEKGEGPWSVATRNNISIDQLVHWNPSVFSQGVEKGTYMLHPGMLLNVSDPSSADMNNSSAMSTLPFDSGNFTVRPDNLPLFTNNWMTYTSIYSEFKRGYGPVNSVMGEGHPATQELKNYNNEVARMRFLTYAKFNGDVDSMRHYSSKNNQQLYTSFASHSGVFYPWSERGGASQFIGTFSGDVFMSYDKISLIFVITDSKSFHSLIYHTTHFFDHPREGSGDKYGNTYQKYIWAEKIDLSIVIRAKAYNLVKGVAKP